MKSAKLFFLFLSIIFFNNCTHVHQVKIEVVASRGQMTDHKGVVTSKKKHSVSLSNYELGMLNSKAIFLIIVENCGDKPIVFSNDNIQVIFKSNSKGWSLRKIRLESSADTMKDIQNEISDMTIAAVMTARGSNTGTWNNNASPYEFKKYKLEMANEALSLKMLEIKTMMAQSYYSLPRILIKPEIITPNDSISGIFVCDTSEMKDRLSGNFIISVNVDSEEHKFIFSRN